MNNRSKGEHLTEADIELLRQAFHDGRASSEVARELGWSKRSVTRYYAIFRGKPQQLGAPKYKPRPRAPSPKPLSSRFYKSSFEL